MKLTSRLRVLVAALAACAILHLGTNKAVAQPAIDAALIAGVDQDTTAIGRLVAGGLYGFGKTRLAAEAHLGFDGFLRINKDQGIAAKSFNFDVGGRYGIQSDHFVGPYLTAGANFGLFVGKPHERKVEDDPDVCATADTTDSCNYRINKNFNFRFGFGWGFASSKKTTVGIRLDVQYWLLSVSPFEDQPGGAPIPREIPRPQDSIAVMVGFEFMRWR